MPGDKCEIVPLVGNENESDNVANIACAPYTK